MSLVSPLALFGGRPAFEQPLHVGRPNLGDRQDFLRRVNEVLDSRWLSNDGRFLREFEARLAEVAGTQQAVVFTNATVALEWTLRALNIVGEVIVPDFTFVATGHAVLSAGCELVLGDVDPHSHILAARSVRRLSSSRVGAIMGVYAWGCAKGVGGLLAEAHRLGVPLIMDGAHALGSTHNGEPLGALGTACVYSFHATKFVNSLEGGAVVTNDASLADRLRLMRNFGIASYDNAVVPGTNGKMDEIRAAMGIGSLEAMSSIVAGNRRNWDLYSEYLGGVEGLSVCDFSDRGSGNFQYVVLEVGEECPLNRDEILDVLWTENVIARRYFFPGLHRMAAFRASRRDEPLPGSRQASESVLVMPTGQAMTPESVERVCRIVRQAVDQGPAIRTALESCTLPKHPRHPAQDEQG